jgi:serine/threonine protein kinase
VYVTSAEYTTLEFYRLALELCDVLTFLHRRNVAHRDLKVRPDCPFLRRRFLYAALSHWQGIRSGQRQ